MQHRRPKIMKKKTSRSKAEPINTSEEWLKAHATHECRLPGTARITPEQCEKQRYDFCRFVKLRKHIWVAPVMGCPKHCPHWRRKNIRFGAEEIIRVRKANFGMSGIARNQKIGYGEQIEIVKMFQGGMTMDGIAEKTGRKRGTVALVVYRNGKDTRTGG